jgi:AraC-like DNA-binding protein
MDSAGEDEPSPNERGAGMKRERFQLWRSGQTAGVELMDVTSSDRCWRVVHDRYCVSICIRGVTEYRYRGRTYAKSAGVITVHEPGEAYDARSQHGFGAATVFSIAPATFQAWATREMVKTRHFVPEPRAEPTLARRWRELAGIIRAGLSAAEIEGSLGGAMAETFACRAECSPTTTGKKEHRAVALVKARLHDGVHEKVSLEELAAEVGLHKLYLLSVFKKEVGVPPHTYQLQLRVAHARSMLARGAPILDVVTQLGFSDQSHLSRHFRRAFGIPPGEYVRRLRDAGPGHGEAGDAELFVLL